MSERKARKDTNRPQKTQNTRKKNNYGKGTKLKFGENGPREEVRAERTANRRSVREGTIAAFAAMVIILGGGTAALRHFDRKEIPQTELATRFVDAPDPVLDLELFETQRILMHDLCNSLAYISEIRFADLACQCLRPCGIALNEAVFP